MDFIGNGERMLLRHLVTHISVQFSSVQSLARLHGSSIAEKRELGILL